MRIFIAAVLAVISLQLAEGLVDPAYYGKPQTLPKYEESAQPEYKPHYGHEESALPEYNPHYGHDHDVNDHDHHHDHEPETSNTGYWNNMKQRWEERKEKMGKWRSDKKAAWQKWMANKKQAWGQANKSHSNWWNGRTNWWETKAQKMHNKGKEFLGKMWGDFWGDNGKELKEAAEDLHEKVKSIHNTAVKKATRFVDTLLDSAHDTLHEMAPPADKHRHGYYSSRVGSIFNHIASNTKTKEELQNDAMNAIVTLAEMAGLLCDGEVEDEPDRIELCKDGFSDTGSGDDMEEGSDDEDGDDLLNLIDPMEEDDDLLIEYPMDPVDEVESAEESIELPMI